MAEQLAVPSSRRFRGWWMLEAAIGLAVVAGANWWWARGDVGFRRLPLSPYFILVLLFALRYGTSAGFATGLASAALLAVWTGRFDLEDGSLLLPVLLVAVGTSAGEFVRSRWEQLHFHRERSAVLSEELSEARHDLGVKDKALRQLKGQVEQEGLPVATLFRMSRRMDSLDPAAVHEAILDFLAVDLKSERAAVYERVDGKFLLRSARVAQGSAPAAPELRVDAGLAELALRRNRVVSVLEADEREGVLCGPIRQDSEVRLLVWVDQLPLAECTPASVARFTHVLEWAESTLRRVRAFRDAREKALIDPDLKMYSAGYLREHLNYEIQRFRRYRTPVALILVRIGEGAPPPLSDGGALHEEVHRILRSSVRTSDRVFGTSRRDTLALVVHVRGEEETPVILDRINRARGGIPLSYGISCSDSETAYAVKFLGLAVARLS